MKVLNVGYSLPLHLTSYEGKKYTVKFPIQSGGKAGKGHNKTSTIQVIYNQFLVKQIRYIRLEYGAMQEAIYKAVVYCVGPREANKYFDK